MVHPLVVILVLPISIRLLQCYLPPLLQPFQQQARKKNTFRKTIVLVSLTSTSADKPSSSKSPGLNYTVVTQVVVTWRPTTAVQVLCCGWLSEAAGWIWGHASKCFHVLDTETSRSIEHWKSTRKILVASLSLYTRLKGTSADPERARVRDAFNMPA